MKNFEKYFNTNKNTWNNRTSAHQNSQFYNVDAFLKGENTLNTYELNALGDISQKKILHLQCHFGQDTLSLARMGAECTGVDFSENAIELAQKLNKKLQLNAQFICCNVYDIIKYVPHKFDIVFASYGVLGWLPDLNEWAKIIFEKLKRGGQFYLVEFHPIAWMFDYTVLPPKLKYPYHFNEPVFEDYLGTYAVPESTIESKEYTWNHSLSNIIQSLLNAGLKLDMFKEHEGIPYNVFPDLVKQEDGLFYSKERLFPLLFEVKFIKS